MDLTQSQKMELSSLAGEVLFDEPMKEHTSFQIGGNADALIEAGSVDEIRTVSSWCKENGVRALVMGNGSNMLVSDEGIRGVVIKIGAKLSACRAEGEMLYAESGILLSKLSKFALSNSLSGLEFAAGIPGTLGGGVFMNAGAYGGEMKDVVKSVTYLDEAGNLQTAGCEQLAFGYRKSMFSSGGKTILSCEMELKKGNPQTIKEDMAEYNRRRAEKQPLSMPSAGSTFKRPGGYFAGKLIQDAGLKGYRIGGAQVSEKHTGFVINAGGATAQDVMDLIEYIQKTVKEKFGVTLEPEVRVIR